ncbi:MAG: TolC family outer membrane protein [Hyphomicrobiaceae bacterium]|nr:TolC family outer membrane protein [Hyphomicrobiaceae bacterium]
MPGNASTHRNADAEINAQAPDGRGQARAFAALRSGASVIALALLFGGGPASAESLSQALASAYRYNPQLDAQRAQLRATDESVAIANSGYRPNITASADTSLDYAETRPSSTSNGTVNNRGYSINLTQPLFTGFRTTYGVKVAEANVRSGREDLRDVERTVLLNAVTAYMDVVRDQAVVRLQENNVNVLSRELKATQDRFAVGEVTRTDVAQAQARRAGSVSALDLAKANLKSSRATYERVVGNPPSNLADPGPPDNLLPRSLEAALAAGEQENAQIISALYLEEAARHNVDQIRGELLPSAQLEASWAQRYDPSPNVEQAESGVVAGRVTVPIYEGGQVYARVRQAKQLHVARLQQVELVRTQVREGVIAAWAQYQAAKAQVQSDRTQVNAAQTALLGVREEEKVGQRTLLDVLNAEQEQLNAQVQLVTDQRNLVVTGYAVLAAVGRLEANRIGAASEVYNPEIHYEEVRRKWWGLSITHEDGRNERVDLWPGDRREAPPMK